MSKIWTVRGVSDDIQQEASKAAQAAGMRLGPWVERVLRAALEQPTPVEQGIGQASPGPSTGDLAALAEVVERRGERLDSMCRLFEEQEKVVADALARLERLEAGGAPFRGRSQGAKRQTATVTPQPSSPKDARTRSIPVEDQETAAALWDSGKGLSFQQIVDAKGWPYHRSALGKAVKRYLDQSAQPRSVEAANEPPTSRSSSA